MDTLITTTMTKDFPSGDERQLAQFLAECVLFEPADGEPMDGAAVLVPALGGAAGLPPAQGCATVTGTDRVDGFWKLNQNEARNSLSSSKDANDSLLRMRRMGCLNQTKSLAKRLYALVKSEVGLLLLLVAYSLLGAAAFSALERPHEETLQVAFDYSRSSFVASVLNVTRAAEASQRRRGDGVEVVGMSAQGVGGTDGGGGGGSRTGELLMGEGNDMERGVDAKVLVLEEWDDENVGVMPDVDVVYEGRDVMSGVSNTSVMSAIGDRLKRDISPLDKPSDGNEINEEPPSVQLGAAGVENDLEVGGESEENKISDWQEIDAGVSEADSYDENVRYRALEARNENYTAAPRNASALEVALNKLLDKYIALLKENRMYGQLEKGPLSWTYWGALFFCGTVVTTVGYGNIAPVTQTGRIATMVYALFGIPLCLIVLARLGRTLTRAIKFLWSFARRFYYTGSCQRVRKLIPKSRLRLSFVQRITAGVRRRTLRRGGGGSSGGERGCRESDVIIVAAHMDDVYVPYEVDDNFNLPPIVALVIAFLYILLGAFMYTLWEKWTYLDAFYFTFISLCTVGFGDVIPEHPKFFLATSVYVLVGLALVSMVIHVVMEYVSDTIDKATESVVHVGQKILSVAPVQCMTAHEPSTLAEMAGLLGPARRRRSF